MNVILQFGKQIAIKEVLGFNKSTFHSRGIIWKTKVNEKGTKSSEWAELTSQY